MPLPGSRRVAIKQLALNGDQFPVSADNITIVREPANMANGMALDKEGFGEWGKRDTGLGYRGRGTSLERLARRLGSKGCRDRLGEDPAQWLSCASTPLDRGAHLCLACHLASTRQRL